VKAAVQHLEQAAQRDARGRLQPGHRMGRPPGTSLIERFRELVRPHWQQIVSKAVEQAKAGDERAREWIGDRYVPKPRPTPPRVVIPGLKEADTLEAKARCIITAGAEGLLSPEEVDRWLATLSNVAKILAFDDLEQRLRMLEDRARGRLQAPGGADDAELVDVESLPL
jgi:hypothetical protein